MPQLEVQSIHTAYGLSQVLFGISLSVEAGQITSLIGRNGVGKTTTMRSIMGLTPASSGKVLFEEINIRLDNKQNKILVLLIFIYKFLKHFKKINS